MTIRTVLLLALMAMPGIALAQQPALHPLSEILADGPTFTGLTATSVTVELDTTLPVACSVVYGTTPAFGAIATDTDMAGGGHTHHHPLLGGLAPNTTYLLRMQGTAPDGTIYVSDTYSLTTPAAAPAAANPLGRNVALASEGAMVAAVSSNYGGGDLDSSYGGNKAIDGDPATEWSSNGDGDKAWIEIDLGRETQITGVGLRTRTMTTSAQIASFRVLTDKGDILGPFTLPDATAVFDFPAAATAKTLRFEVVSSSGGNTGVGEIAVYAR
jgi:hypothetical protein